jgi:hypothetical protein
MPGNGCSLSLSETPYFLWRLSLPVSTDNVHQYAPKRHCTACRHSVQTPNPAELEVEILALRHLHLRSVSDQAATNHDADDDLRQPHHRHHHYDHHRSGACNAIRAARAPDFLPCRKLPWPDRIACEVALVKTQQLGLRDFTKRCPIALFEMRRRP